MNTLPEIWEKEIINIPGNVNWIYETSVQLVKDFTMLNLPLKFEPMQDASYLKLFNESVIIVQQLFEKDHHALLNLLYRIDISESQVRKITGAYQPPELYGKVAEMLLKREFMKVVYRYRYSVE